MLMREMLPRELLAWCRQAAPRRPDLFDGLKLCSAQHPSSTRHTEEASNQAQYRRRINAVLHGPDHGDAIAPTA